MAEELTRASDLLASAADDASTNTDRLRELSDQLEKMAAGERTTDHGGLARIQSAMDEVQTEVDDDVAATIDEANDAINAHRETLEGV